MGWDNKLQGRFRVGVGRIVYCEGCGDGCLSGGYVRRNLQREAERMIRCPAKRVPPSDAHDAPTAYARGREDALRELLATGYPTCGEGGHMSPNLPREAERMLAEAIAYISRCHKQWAMSSVDYQQFSQAYERVRVLRPLLATGCPRCKGTGYVEGESCPDCQPDAKENDDED